MSASRIDTRRLLLIVLFAALLPLSMLFLLDQVLMTWPVLTIVGVVLVLPLGTFLVGRAALSEMNRVIEAVAPPEDDRLNDGDVCADEAGGEEVGDENRRKEVAFPFS